MCSISLQYYLKELLYDFLQLFFSPLLPTLLAFYVHASIFPTCPTIILFFSQIFLLFSSSPQLSLSLPPFPLQVLVFPSSFPCFSLILDSCLYIPCLHFPSRLSRVSEVFRKNKKKGLLSSQMITLHDNTR
jgi:hypothetical protein